VQQALSRRWAILRKSPTEAAGRARSHRLRISCRITPGRTRHPIRSRRALPIRGVPILDPMRMHRGGRTKRSTTFGASSSAMPRWGRSPSFVPVLVLGTTLEKFLHDSIRLFLPHLRLQRPRSARTTTWLHPCRPRSGQSKAIGSSYAPLRQRDYGCRLLPRATTSWCEAADRSLRRHPALPSNRDWGDQNTEAHRRSRADKEMKRQMATSAK
jgi:hypothetical protein